MTVNSTAILKNCVPIRIYILWHNSFKDGRKYAETLYRTFSRDDTDFSGQSIGLPIFFCDEPNLDLNHIKETANKTAFVLLITPKMVIDEKWQNFVEEICNLTDENENFILYPVAINTSTLNGGNSAYNLSSKLSRKNFIKLNNLGKPDEDNFDIKFKELCFQLAHELCRLLYDRERISEGRNTNLVPSVTLFLSHARCDGKIIADRINKYISIQTSLKTFIDVNDIPKGENVERLIKDSTEKAVFLAIWTDKYSSREWCQKEIMDAKKMDCPIILLDALSVGEVRRFPYGSNVRTIHWSHSNLEEISDDEIKKIVFEVLLETLKSRFNELYLNYAVDLYAVNKKSTKIFKCSPELYTLLINLNNDEECLLYPDPPLNINELEVLKKLNGKCCLITPTFLPCYKNKKIDLFSTKNIGISISDIEENEKFVKDNIHLATFYIELCRYLIAAGANLIYAGNFAFKGKINFVDELYNLIHNYSFFEQRENRVKLFYLDNSDHSSEMAALKPYFKFISISTIETEGAEEMIKANLTKLRTESAKDVFARIVVGGKMKGYQGRYPGIIEEAYIALENRTPLYVIGAYGGAGEVVAGLLAEEKNDSINDAEIIKKFNETGFNKLNNGLSKEENIELCYCEDIHRSIALILKGLSNLVR